MKKFFLSVCLIAAICALSFGFCKREERAEDCAQYLRIHIRADSNEKEAQAVKYLVRDNVVEYLTPVLSETQSKEQAMRAVKDCLNGIEAVASRTLSENGFLYGARASLKREEFPTRVYEGATLGAGEYDALILELGSGKGDNWWCVVYPPLCFSGGNGNVVYKSKIAEIIRRFFQNKEKEATGVGIDEKKGIICSESHNFF